MSPNSTPPRGTITARDVWKRFKPDRSVNALTYELRRVKSRLTGRPLDWQWALRDVNLVAEPGEAIGLVGNNGSGKTTLLKIIGKVMYPYAGSVDVQGRIGAIIAVKAGIQPELTGAENIYMYGTLLGLKRKQVVERFDEIVAFAQLEGAIDRQVKYYSSGMQMRLGFGVAAHLDPDVLLVDEVLSVGDATFQQRCLDRMRVVLSQGTTVAFVSHDLASVQAISTRGMWLDRGLVRADGPVADVLAEYRRAIEGEAEESFHITGEVEIADVSVSNPEGGMARTQEPCEIRMTLKSEGERSVLMFIGLTEGTADPIVTFRHPTGLYAGATEIRCRFPNLPLPRGRFYVWCEVADSIKGQRPIVPWQPIAQVDVFGPDLDLPPRAVVRRAPFHAEMTWEISEGSSSPDGADRSDGTTIARAPDPASMSRPRRTRQLRAPER